MKPPPPLQGLAIVPQRRERVLPRPHDVQPYLHNHLSDFHGVKSRFSPAVSQTSSGRIELRGSRFQHDGLVFSGWRGTCSWSKTTQPYRQGTGEDRVYTRGAALGSRCGAQALSV